MNETMKRIESKLDGMNFALKGQQSRNKHENELPYRPKTHPKTTEGKHLT